MQSARARKSNRSGSGSSATQLVVFDLETGGLETHRPIIQIAAIAIDEDFNEREVFEVKVKFDETKACPDALRRVHYRRAEWKRSAVTPKKAAWAFCPVPTTPCERRSFPP